MNESMRTASAVANHGHIQAARGSSGTASFGVGYNASVDEGEDEVTEVNESQISDIVIDEVEVIKNVT